MASITINGVVYNGNVIQQIDDKVWIDGQLVVSKDMSDFSSIFTQGSANYLQLSIHISATTAEVVNVKSKGNVTVLSGARDIEADGNISIKGSAASVKADGNVTCGNVAGDVKAGGNVVAGNVAGSVKAGGNLICSR